MTRSPAEDGHEQLAGAPASFAVTVKDVKRKDLPELDEDFAIDVGFDAVEDLREDVRERLHLAEEQRLKGEFRQAALDAAVSHATLLTPPALVQARAQEMWERMLHSLSHRGISKEAYLQIDGRSELDVVAEIVPDAEQALRREAVLTAVVEAEATKPSEEDLLEAVRPTAEREQLSAEEVLEKLRASARLEELREDLAARPAIDLIAQEAKPIPLEQAKAREKLWTPEKRDEGRAAGAPGGLWTPDR